MKYCLHPRERYFSLHNIKSNFNQKRSDKAVMLFHYKANCIDKETIKNSRKIIEKDKGIKVLTELGKM